MAFGFVGSHVPESLRLRVLVVSFIARLVSAQLFGACPVRVPGVGTENLQKLHVFRLSF